MFEARCVLDLLRRRRVHPRAWIGHRRLGEQPGFDLQILPGPGPGRLVLACTILEDHQVPTTPMSTDQPQERFMRVLGPILGDQQREIAAPDIDRPMEDPLVVGPANRHSHLLADGTIAGIQRRRLRDNRFVQHQQHGARAILEAAF